MAGSTHSSFQDIIKKLMEDSYIEGLCKSLKALKIVATSSKPVKSKCKLMDLLKKRCDESDDGEINNGAGCSSKYVKKAVYSDDY